MRVISVKPLISSFSQISQYRITLVSTVHSHEPSIFIALYDVLDSKDVYKVIKSRSSWEWSRSKWRIIEKVVENFDEFEEVGDVWGGGRKSKKSKMSIRQNHFTQLKVIGVINISILLRHPVYFSLNINMKQ